VNKNELISVVAEKAGLSKTDAAKVPAMVLIHGGGGTAFADWAKLWTGRGYAAIAMDLCGCVPRKMKNGWERHEQGGPPGWGGFEQIDGEEHDQWTWHAVADAILGHSLLRSLPEVDADRIGVTGISWGGYLTCITASVDRRFKFAAPVYGCGFLGDDSTWLDTFAKMGKEKADKWLGLWEPSRYLSKATMPFLWVNGTNDFAYPLDSYQKSYRLPQTERTLAIRVRMAHAHGGPGEKPEEIHAFAREVDDIVDRAADAHRHPRGAGVGAARDRSALGHPRSPTPAAGRHRAARRCLARHCRRPERGRRRWFGRTRPGEHARREPALRRPQRRVS
jgi:dienelactone hydrolase